MLQQIHILHPGRPPAIVAIDSGCFTLAEAKEMLGGKVDVLFPTDRPDVVLVLARTWLGFRGLKNDIATNIYQRRTLRGPVIVVPVDCWVPAKTGARVS